MKIAVCYNGILNRSSDINKFVTNQHALMSNSIKGDHDIDVFCHSWHNDLARNIDNILKPTKSLHEKQIEFELKEVDIHRLSNESRLPIENETLQFIKNIPQMKRHHPAYARTHNWYSNCYSIQQVINLKRDYEMQNKFKYDLIILCRYDSYIKRHFDPSDIGDLNNVYVECCEMNMKNYIHKVNRQWIQPEYIIFNSENADLYSNIYNHLDTYRSDFRMYKNVYRNQTTFYDHVWKADYIVNIMKKNIKEFRIKFLNVR